MIKETIKPYSKKTNIFKAWISQKTTIWKSKNN